MSCGGRVRATRWPEAGDGAGTTRRRSRPNASDRRETEMDALMLDGNAVAGLLVKHNTHAWIGFPGVLTLQVTVE